MWYDNIRLYTLRTSHSRYTLSKQNRAIRKGSYERLINNYYGKNSLFKRALPFANNCHLLEINEATKDVELTLSNFLYDTEIDMESNTEDLVESYNKLLKSFDTLDNGVFSNRRNWLNSLTNTYSTELQRAGLMISEDGTLIKKSKEDQGLEARETLQSLFQREDSYGKHLLVRTVNIGYEALSSLSKSPKLYNSNGSHIYSIATGNLYNAIY